MTVHPKDGKPFDLKLSHTFNEPQITWFKAGSALNGENIAFPVTASTFANKFSSHGQGSQVFLNDSIRDACMDDGCEERRGE